MAEKETISSNQILDILAQWNDVLNRIFADASNPYDDDGAMPEPSP